MPELFKFSFDEMLFELQKTAQQTASQARQIALQLGTKLVEKAKEAEENPNFDIFFKDIEDLPSYLQFLYTNKLKSGDGNRLALLAGGSGINAEAIPPGKENLYKKIDQYNVYADGVVASLNSLKGVAQQAGNEIMKPALKRLIEVFNAAAGASLGTDVSGRSAPQGGVSPDGLIRQNPYGTATDPNAKGYNGGTGAASTPNTQVAGGQGQNQKDQANEVDASTNVRANLPFKGRDRLSPGDMSAFTRTFAKYLEGGLVADPNKARIYQLVRQYDDDMKDAIARWGQLISLLKNQVSGVSSYVDTIDYPLGNSPNAQLKDDFGSTSNANSARKLLKSMVALSIQALDTIPRDRELSSLIPEATLNGQLTAAQNYNNALAVEVR